MRDKIRYGPSEIEVGETYKFRVEFYVDDGCPSNDYTANPYYKVVDKKDLEDGNIQLTLVDENEIKITAVYNPIDHKGYFMD